ncbi:MAG: hypothetical protein DMD89_16960 [Candidatus Rokuibacteriota bacterium]|nr:MAG: hypothetical protein DMD89_16960 [Candidatus Rokubacteria bacterium]
MRASLLARQPGHLRGNLRSISRRTFIALLAATFAPRPANGQPVRRTWRIGYLNPGSSALAPIRLDPLRDGLREVGYVEGKGVVIEARWAEGLGMRFQVLEVRGPSDLEAAFQALPRDRRRAVLVFPDPLTFSHRRRIMEVAEQDHAPSVAGSREFVDAGGLMSYGPSFPAMFRQAAMYVSKILKGAKPADLPVEQPTKFELVINLKTAKTLGLTIPQSLLLRADEVIE